MIKVRYFVLAAALVTGTALGLMDVFHFGKGAAPFAVEGEMRFRSQSAPFFGKQSVKKDVAQISPVFANFGVLIPLYANMSLDELRAEIKRLHELDDEDSIRFLLLYLVRKVGRDFPGEVRSFLDNGLIDSSSDYAEPLLEGWSSEDFDGAMAYFLDNRRFYSSYVFVEMVRGLTQEQPDKAMEWMMTQTGKVRQNALFEMLGVLSEKHPAKLKDFVGKLLPEDFKKEKPPFGAWEKEGLFDAVTKSWGSCDWEAALLWADTLSGNQKNKAIAGILGGLGTSNLEKATEEYKKYPKELQGDIATAIVKSLSDKDDVNTFAEINNFSATKQALEWLMVNRAESDDAGGLVGIVVDTSDLWTPDFVDYVQKMPEGVIKDHALHDMSDIAVANVKYENCAYEEAFALSDQIKDPALRLESKLSNARSWIYDEPEAARDWVQKKSGFPDEEKQNLFDFCEMVLSGIRFP